MIDELLEYIQFKVSFRHCIEAIILVIALLFFRRLIRTGWGAVVAILSFLLFVDVFVFNQSKRFFPEMFAIELTLIMVGVAYWKNLRRYRVESMVGVVIIWWIADLIAAYLVSNGMYNLYVFNISYIINAVLFYVFVLRVLELRKKVRKIFTGCSIISIIFFISVYFTSEEASVHSLTVVVFQSQSIILSCIILAKMSIDDNCNRKLTEEPVFFVCAGIIVMAVVDICIFGLYNYLGKYHSEPFKFLYFEIMPVGFWLMWSLFLYGFTLARKHDFLDESISQKGIFH